MSDEEYIKPTGQELTEMCLDLWDIDQNLKARGHSLVAILNKLSMSTYGEDVMPKPRPGSSLVAMDDSHSDE